MHIVHGIVQGQVPRPSPDTMMWKIIHHLQIKLPEQWLVNTQASRKVCRKVLRKAVKFAVCRAQFSCFKKDRKMTVSARAF